MTEDRGCDSRRFWVLFSIFSLLGFLVPLAGYFYSGFLALTNHMDNIWSFIGSESVFVGGALANSVMIYIVMRYRLRRCLLLVLPVALLNICDWVIGVIILQKVNQPINYAGQALIVAVGVIVFILNVVFIWLAASRLKNEWVILLASLGILIFLSLFRAVAGTLLTYLFNISDFRMAGISISRQLESLPRLMPNYLKAVLITGAGYILLALLFSEKKRQNCQRAICRVKATASKLWEATAK